MHVDPSHLSRLFAGASSTGDKAAPGDGAFGAALSAETEKQRSTPRKAEASAPTAHAAHHPGSAVDKEHPRPAGASRNERYIDVPGRAYDEIVHGPRNGMFINRSGNERDGQAFVRVRRDGREFHVYGTGKDRVVVEVRRRDADKPAVAPGVSAGGWSPTNPWDRPEAVKDPAKRIVGAGATAGGWSPTNPWDRPEPVQAPRRHAAGWTPTSPWVARRGGDS